VRKALAILLLSIPLLAGGPKPKVTITTSMGDIQVELEPEATPKTVENFLKYVRKGQYDGTIFHRVKPGGPGIIQGGGHLPDLTKKPTDGSIKCEADLAKAAKLLNTKGTIAMARESLPDSAKAQFFINVKDNPDLNFKARTLSEFGYCVFGRVTKGMDVVARITKVKTGPQGGMTDVPVKPVTIITVKESK
jgi:cyclophilin family peptidyl-prolyl cis-trans isomerase